MEIFEQLKQSVKAVIKQNGRQEITGQILQDVLIAIIDQVGEGATFLGIANSKTKPTIPQGKGFYICHEVGVYNNFDGTELAEGELMISGYSPNKMLWQSEVIISMQDVIAKNKKQDEEIAGLKQENARINGRIDDAEEVAATQGREISAIKDKNVEQDEAIQANDNKITGQDLRLDALEVADGEQDIAIKANKALSEKNAKEQNTFNLSIIKPAPYTLQSAISALNTYLGSRPKGAGLKCVYRDAQSRLQAYVYIGGEFTSTNNWVLDKDERALRELLHAVESLKRAIDNTGDHKAVSYDARENIKVCGYPVIIYGHGTPSAETIPAQRGIPKFIGQQYINLDASSNGLYYAIGTSGVENWKNA